MYCSKCGKPIADDSAFCMYCGTKLDEYFVNSEDISTDILTTCDDTITEQEPSMSIKIMKCPYCNKDLSVDTNYNAATCCFCNQVFSIDEKEKKEIISNSESVTKDEIVAYVLYEDIPLENIISIAKSKLWSNIMLFLLTMVVICSFVGAIYHSVDSSFSLSFIKTFFMWGAVCFILGSIVYFVISIVMKITVTRNRELLGYFFVTQTYVQDKYYEIITDKSEKTGCLAKGCLIFPIVFSIMVVILLILDRFF